MLTEIKVDPKNIVYPKHAIDYKAFKEKFRKDEENELCSLEKFYATRKLIEQGYSRIFVNAKIILPTTNEDEKIILTDVCGELDGHITIAFCESTQLTKELYNKLKVVGSIENISVILLHTFKEDLNTLIQWFSEYFQSGKFSYERVPWLSDELEEVFDDALNLITLLGNRTRVKMLLPLLKKSRRKRHFRMRINPKLVYANISTLMIHGIVDEYTKNEYALTPIGRQILCEYLAFIQKVKKTLEKDDRR